MSKARTPLSRLVSLYRRATRGGVRIGYQYGNGVVWDQETGQYRPLNIKHIVTLQVCGDQYVWDDESFETRALRRHEFWNQFVRFARTGYREIAA